MNELLSKLQGLREAYFPDVVLKNPEWLWLLVLLLPILWLRGRGGPAIVMPFAAAWYKPKFSFGTRVLATLLMLGIACLALSLTRPQRIEEKQQIATLGYDIILAIDVSMSMLMEDYKRDGKPINRMQAIKPVLQAFINQRPDDRIGIVVFSGRAYTLAPLTFDHEWLAKQAERLKVGLLEDGTAIGDALGVSLARLDQAKRSEEGRRQGAFVVLLTDGASNKGMLDPTHSAELAKTRGIPVYTIGAGRNGMVPFPAFDEAGNRVGTRLVVSEMDEPMMRYIAQRTGGKYFRAADTGTVEQAFATIDRLQKISFQARSYRITTELFLWPALAGAALVLLAALLLQVFSRKSALA